MIAKSRARSSRCFDLASSRGLVLHIGLTSLRLSPLNRIVPPKKCSLFLYASICNYPITVVVVLVVAVAVSVAVVVVVVVVAVDVDNVVVVAVAVVAVVVVVDVVDVVVVCCCCYCC